MMIDDDDERIINQSITLFSLSLSLFVVFVSRLRTVGVVNTTTNNNDNNNNNNNNTALRWDC